MSVNNPEKFKNITVVAGGSFWVLLGKIAGALIQLVSNVVLARALGASAVGEFAFLFSLLSLISIVSHLGGQQLLLKYVAIYQGNGQERLLRGLFEFVILYTLPVAFIAILFFASQSSLVAEWTSKKYLTSTLAILSPSILLFCIINICAHTFQGAKLFTQYALIREIGLNLALLCPAILAWHFKFTFETFLSHYLISLILLAVLSSITAYQKFSFLRVFKSDYVVRNWVSFALPVAAASIIQSTVGLLDTIILGFLQPEHLVGIYYIALRTALLANMILVATNAILAPLAAGLWHAKKITELSNVYKLTTKWCFIFTLPLVIILSIYRQEIMSIFGNEFKFASQILVVLLVGRFFNSITGGVSQLLVMTGHQKIELINSIIHISLLMCINIWVATRYSIWAIAVANSCIVISMNLLRLVQVYHLVGIHPYHRDWLKPIIAMLVSGIGYIMFRIFSTQIQTLTPTLVGGTLLLFIYIVMILILGFSDDENYLIDKIRSRATNVFM